MKTFFFSIFVLGCFVYSNSQTVELPETIISINSDYLNSVDTENSCSYVQKLEQALLNYDHSELSDLYDSDNDIYKVIFKLPEGKIIASFNKDGKIVKTLEKYNNIRLPLSVTQAITEKYPNYAIVEDVYVVKFHCDVDAIQQEYTVKIKKEDTILTLKTNEKGEFI